MQSVSKSSLTAVTVIMLSGSLAAMAQTDLPDYHASCAIDDLSESVEYTSAQHELTWSRSALVGREVYCDEYTAADLTPGGVRTRYRERFEFFSANVNITVIDTDGIHQPTTTVNLWDADSANRYITLAPQWYQPAIETSAGYLFDQGGGYVSCCYAIDDQPLRASGVVPECMDSDGDGWGWNGTATCRVSRQGSVAGSCDYSLSSIHDGWGWNAVTETSCAATEDTTSSLNYCDYGQADSQEGWGWNRATGESCPPTPESLVVYTDQHGECDYQDARINNGWGWNRITEESCRQ